MNLDVPPLRAEGDRVWVASATEADDAAYALAREQSRRRLQEWNPVDPYGLPALVHAASRFHRTLLIHTREPEGQHDLVGKVNVTNVVRGRAMTGTLGYDAFDPYAGRGLFAEGLRLAVDLAFAPEPRGMGLHRLEANVQPGNTRSAAVLRVLGFRLEGFSPAYLLMPSREGAERWRDHDRYAVLATEWPAPPWQPARSPRVVALVNGVPGSGKTTLARRLSVELSAPMLSKDTVKEAMAQGLPSDAVAALARGRSSIGAGASVALWALLAESPSGAVVESWFWPGDRHHVLAGLLRSGLDPTTVPEVWCELPVATARERFEQRAASGTRHPMHAWPLGDEEYWGRIASAAEPVGVGPVLRVDTTELVSDRTVVDVALRIRAATVESGNQRS